MDASKLHQFLSGAGAGGGLGDMGRTLAGRVSGCGDCIADGHVDAAEQAAERYLASRLAIDSGHPAERAYLEPLAHRLNLPADLVAHLNRQVDAKMDT